MRLIPFCAMSLRWLCGPAAVCLGATACFNGNDARGLACQNDDQCGTDLECVKASEGDELGVCGGGELPGTTQTLTTGSGSSSTVATDTNSGTIDASDSSDGSDTSETEGPTACGEPAPVFCEGVDAIAAPSFEVLSFPDRNFVGHVAVAIGRFVGSDEWEDIAILNLQQSDVVIYRNNGGAAFERLPDPFQTILNPYDMAAADFDCDGNDDLAVVSLESDLLTFAYGAGVTLEPFDIDGARLAPESWSLAVADFDPDSVGPDVIVACDEQSLLFENLDDRTFGVPKNISTGFATWSVKAGDLDGDTIPDIVIPNADQGDYNDDDDNDFVTIALSGDGFAEQSYGPTSLTNPIDVALLHLDTREGLDLAVLSKRVNGEFTSSNQPGTLSFHSNDGRGSFTQSGADIQVGVGANALATADFNCDGSPDLAVGHDGVAEVWLLWGPDYVPIDATTVAMEEVVGTRLEVGDLNHDGYPDLVVPDYGRTDEVGLVTEDGGFAVVWNTAR